MVGGALTLPATSSSIQAIYSSLPHLPWSHSTRAQRHGYKVSIKASSHEGSDTETSTSESPTAIQTEEAFGRKASVMDGGALDKGISQAVRKTAATFAPRSSTKRKNPAVPGSTLYTIFEVQGYASMAFGGLLSYNVLFPSADPDIWRLMGMWSVWMFTIPSLRARDCSNKEKDALNYLFLGIPLINVLLPLFWKSFAAVWTADVVAFFVMYAWKLNWFSPDQRTER